MKKYLLLPTFSLVFAFGKTQNECDSLKGGAVMYSNDMAVRINTDGTLFHDENGGFFKIPYFGEGSPSPIRQQELWPADHRLP